MSALLIKKMLPETEELTQTMYGWAIENNLADEFVHEIMDNMINNDQNDAEWLVARFTKFVLVHSGFLDD